MFAGWLSCQWPGTCCPAAKKKLTIAAAVPMTKAPAIPDSTARRPPCVAPKLPAWLPTNHVAPPTTTAATHAIKPKNVNPSSRCWNTGPPGNPDGSGLFDTPFATTAAAHIASPRLEPARRHDDPRACSPNHSPASASDSKTSLAAQGNV